MNAEDNPPTQDETTEARPHHSIGGSRKYMCEPIDIDPHKLSVFDREVDALRLILGRKNIMVVDELRKELEALPEEEYHRLGYYNRWIRSIVANLLKKGVLTEAEIRSVAETAR